MLLCVGVCFNGSNLLKRAIEYYLVLKSGPFHAHLTNSRQYAHIVRIIVPVQGIIYSMMWAIVYYVRWASPEPQHCSKQ